MTEMRMEAYDWMVAYQFSRSIIINEEIPTELSQTSIFALKIDTRQHIDRHYQ